MMLPYYRRFCLLLALATTGCGDGSFVQGYQPSYTSSQGETIIGDFFPLVPGMGTSFSTTITGMTTSEVSGSGESGEPTTSTVPFDQTQTHTTEILPEEAVVLTSGTVQAFPELTTVTSDTSGVTSLTTWYAGSNGAVRLVALENPLTSAVIEVVEGEVVRNPMRVGDTWPRATDASAESFFSAETMPELTQDGAVHVLGFDSEVVNGVEVDTVTLVVLGESSLTQSDEESRLSATSTSEQEVVMARGLGILRSRTEVTSTSDLTLTIEGVTQTSSSTYSATAEVTRVGNTVPAGTSP